MIYLSISKKFAILSAAVLCLQALPVFSASASSSLSAEQAARADAYAYLADFGADEDILAAAVNSSGLDSYRRSSAFAVCFQLRVLKR